MADVAGVMSVIGVAESKPRRTHLWRSSAGKVITSLSVPSRWGNVLAEDAKRMLEHRLYLPILQNLQVLQ
jgi:hypothetical protein